jgi:hypothetical protein
MAEKLIDDLGAADAAGTVAHRLVVGCSLAEKRRA